MNISIRQLIENEWPLFREIRLRALKSDPNVFSATYEQALTQTEAEWKKFVGHPDYAIFTLFDADTPIGLSAIAIDRDDPSKKQALMFASWLPSDYRGQGISALMYSARIEWARKHPTCEVITVSHRESNVASKNANQKHGFVYTHRKERVWPDGATEAELCYELVLKTSS